MTVYRLRVVIAGISPLIWRRLLSTRRRPRSPVCTPSCRPSFGWSGEHLHRFVIGGTEYGIGYVGGPGFRDDARQVRLADLGLREGERFAYEYNFSAAWRVDLRVEQITGAPPGRAYPRCTGGRRAGPPEDWAGPWDFLEQTQPHLVFGAIVRAREIIGQLLDAGEHHDLADAGVDREELAALMPLLGLERFDRRACNQVLRGLAVGVQTVAEGSRSMKFSVQVIVHPDDDTEASPVVREVFAADRDDLAPGHPRPAARRGEGPAGGGAGHPGRTAGQRRDHQAGGLPGLRAGAPAQGHAHDRGAQLVRRAAAGESPLVALRLPRPARPDLPAAGRAAARADHPGAGLPAGPLRRPGLLRHHRRPAR